MIYLKLDHLNNEIYTFTFNILLILNLYILYV